MKRHIDSPGWNPLSRAFRKLLPAYRVSSFGGPTIPPRATIHADANVTDNGERVVPENNDFCFFAHLSIYNFAKPFTRGKRVLDAGCGTGYGAHHLLKSGAKSVLGIDLSEKAIEYCRTRYVAPGLHYETLNLSELGSQSRAKFDVVYSSNVLEHVAEVDRFLSTAVRMLAADGVFILGVPAIVTAESLVGNLENPYHLNNLTPPAWLAKLRRFFQEAQGYRHWVEPDWVTPAGDLGYSNDIRAENFTFTERDDASLMNESRTITTIIVAHSPRPTPLPPCADEFKYPDHWNVDVKRPRGFAVGDIGPIGGSDDVVQTFVSDDEEMSRIEIMMGTYDRQNNSTLEVTLHRDSAEGAVIARTTFSAAEIRNCDWMKFDFHTLRHTKGTRYSLVLRALDATETNRVTAFYTTVAIPGREAVAFGGHKRPGHWLHFRTRWST